ncbi:biotin/lipoyl-containing protein [Marinilabilia rubra]|uniref:Oxaloacetate decarboxylase n=1 Tax=Marinilabilia rubra TaxID=2162893 RepID=A0A2U2B5N6_9BACT|nr:biotin/lipoyl-containing protein [Marinilabilia rubra]PWD98344.1 oxaloacetate decarboxylase [Marinilabilia rubra]
MGRKIGFSLLYRDMWQSAGKFVPRRDQLERVASAIIEMGCFDRVETNGGGFEQINLLFGENPNKAVRAWTQPFNEAGIQTHMLERALNGIRMSPVPADVRKLMFKVKKKQGTDIARSFDGLNDPRNIIDSIKYAKEGGMIAQAAMSLTYSEIHTVEYYVDLAEQLIKAGADEICLKDMAGIARPAWLGKIVKGIRENHQDIPLQYHGHSGPGFSVATLLEAARAGVDYVDVAMEPLSWGTGHADLLTIHAMLKDDGFNVPDINMKAYMKVRKLTQEFIDDFLGHYINPKNRQMNSLLIGPGLPGGMMGSLMADLDANLTSLNKWKVKRDEPELSQDELLIKLFEEVEYIWPKLGYPPLVTPFSQYVKNLALMNILQMEKGRERWSMIADNIWDMILGKSGQVPGKLAPEIIELAEKEGKEFFTGHPQEPYPDALDSFRKEMDENGWDYGEDDEELMELAMHPEQYRNYKSGKAKAAFEADLQEKRNAQKSLDAAGIEDETSDNCGCASSKMNINVNGEDFEVTVFCDGEEDGTRFSETNSSNSESPNGNGLNGKGEPVVSPLEGKFYFTKEAGEKPIKEGDRIKEGDIVGYIEAMKTYNAVRFDKEGVVKKILKENGSDVEEDDELVVVL